MLVRFVLNLLQETIIYIYIYFLIFNIQVETKQGNGKCLFERFEKFKFRSLRNSVDESGRRNEWFQTKR